VLTFVRQPQQGEIRDIRRAAVGPGDHVVHLADLALHGAPRDHTADVAGVERGLLRRSRQPNGAAEVQNGAMLVEDGAADPAAARQKGQDTRMDSAGMLDVREPDPVQRTSAAVRAAA
jgi:hypothetical protein